MATKKTKTAEGQTTAVAPQPPADAMAAVRAARGGASDKDRFHFLKDLEKGAPQAKGIVNILKAAGEGGLTREELVAKMKGVIVTRQPEGRILAYYQKPLVQSGAVRIDKAVAEPANAPAAEVAS